MGKRHNRGKPLRYKYFTVVEHRHRKKRKKGKKEEKKKKGGGGGDPQYMTSTNINHAQAHARTQYICIYTSSSIRPLLSNSDPHWYVGGCT